MTLTNDNAVSNLLQFIVDNYMVELDEIPLDKSLIDEGIIDSFGLIEISSYLERTFGITIAEEDMIRENFGSVNKMIAFASRKQAA